MRSTAFAGFGVLLSFFLISGCATEFNLATGREERLMYDTEREMKIGDSVSRQLEKNFELVTDRAMNDRAQRILNRLKPVSDRADMVYVIRILDNKEMNAVSLPGGYIYLFRGLMEKVPDDEELAAVIAHEMGHIDAKHGLKKLQASYGYTFLQALAVASADADLARGVNAIYTVAFFAYSQEDEFEADHLAVKYMRRAGYDPAKAIGVLEKLEREDERRPLRRVAYLRTHPFIHQRIAAVKEEITGELDFDGYLDLMDRQPARGF